MNFLKCLDKYLDLREKCHVNAQFHGTYFKAPNDALKERLAIARKELEDETEKMLKHSHCTVEL